jgi:hypothetical protein
MALRETNNMAATEGEAERIAKRLFVFLSFPKAQGSNFSPTVACAYEILGSMLHLELLLKKSLSGARRAGGVTW